MQASSDRRVSIAESGRSGSVTYREPAGSLSFPWELHSTDVVAIVQTGDEAGWRRHPWAAARRAEILRFVAAEVVRQKAPNCRAEIDLSSGDILLRQVSPPNRQAPPDVSWVGRLRTLKAMLALVVLAIAMIFAGAVWIKNKVLVIDPGKGAPVGVSARTDRHIATLIQTLEPYTPSLNRDHSKDTYRISLFLVPLDGSKSRTIPIASGLSPNAFSLAKVLGSDGRTLWFDVAGTGGVDLETFELLSADEVSTAPSVPDPVRSSTSPFGPKPEHHLAAGLFTGPDTWLGLHSIAEAERHFKPKSWLKRVVRADNAKEPRRFHRGELDPDTSGEHHSIVSMTPIDDAEYLNAAFLRIDDASEPIRLEGPPGALMVYTSDPGLKSTLMVARADTAGGIVWKVDTGIDRFTLQQILPGEGSTAFVGTRPPVPDQVSEPLLVIVESGTGAVVTYSLWL